MSTLLSGRRPVKFWGSLILDSRFMGAPAVFMAALVMLGPVGCAHRTPLPTAAMEPKPDIGTVSVVVGPDPSSPYFQRPSAVSAGEGAKEGAKTGAIAPLIPGLYFIALFGEPCVRYICEFGLVLIGAGLVLAPVGAAVGAAVGALSVTSEEDVEQGMAALEWAFADINLSDALPAWIIEA